MKGNKFMKKNKNIPLNLREQMNSRIGLICSVILLLLLVAGLRQLDYNLIEKPKEEAAKVAQKEAEAAKKAAEEPEVSTASVIAVGDNLYHGSLIESAKMIPEPGIMIRFMTKYVMRSRLLMWQWSTRRLFLLQNMMLSALTRLLQLLRKSVMH